MVPRSSLQTTRQTRDNPSGRAKPGTQEPSVRCVSRCGQPSYATSRLHISMVQHEMQPYGCLYLVWHFIDCRSTTANISRPRFAKLRYTSQQVSSSRKASRECFCRSSPKRKFDIDGV